ncbi:NAD(P)-binding protein [Aliiglaciecola sp. CAU 1673]|uniref:NAD(P)/FAD-dependent oxidoreductase n=1 Tax=Aliiglaciecola sp. CAU 1673 TaxID=3032595 RepID=UPI0023DC7606|nr:NAD(P)-binding protein [Aliiglaciecola sp. CAU 1673]MDF2177167.1 NAD(P)-binding protein [Aliiglaciecola sp. CAU 1673]
MQIAVVGAGFSGSLVAHRLRQMGHYVSVLEKSRGCGGRSTHKRLSWGVADMGAGLVRTNDQAFINFLSQFEAEKLVQQWNVPAYSNDSGWSPLKDNARHYVFAPGMNSLCRHLLENIDVTTEFRVQHLQQNKKGWLLWDDQVRFEGPFDWVILTAPWPQTCPILAPHIADLPALDEQHWLSCWSVALQLSKPLDTPIQLAYPAHGKVQMLVKDSAKPGRKGENEVWVLQFAHDYSAYLRENAKEDVWLLAAEALTSLFGLKNLSIEGHYQHYWHYARASRSAPLPGIVMHPQLGLAALGDWSTGGSLDAAWRATEGFFARWQELS